MISSTTIIQHTQEIQQLASQFLDQKCCKSYTNIEEWKETQKFLTHAIKQLMQQEGSTPEEEGEAVLAILMGYTLTVRNSRNIELVLARAERVWPLITDPILKCKLAIFCYGECYDEELAEEAHRLIGELKRCDRWEEVKRLEELLISMQESCEIIE